MATVNEQILKVYRGEDLTVPFSNPTPTDINGWALSLQVVGLGGGTPALTLTTAAGDITITDADVGDFEVDFARADTSDLTAQEYRWDVWEIDSGSYKRLAGGKLLVLKPVYPPL